MIIVLVSINKTLAVVGPLEQIYSIYYEKKQHLLLWLKMFVNLVFSSENDLILLSQNRPN